MKRFCERLAIFLVLVTGPGNASNCQDDSFSFWTLAANCPEGEVYSILYHQRHKIGELRHCVESQCEKDGITVFNKCSLNDSLEKQMICQCRALQEIRKCEGNDYCGYYGYSGVCLRPERCELVQDRKHECKVVP